MKLLEVIFDYKLDFYLHICESLQKSCCIAKFSQRLKMFIGFKERKILVQSFVYSNFNYSPWCGISDPLNRIMICF